jgi:hypothetical protein
VLFELYHTFSVLILVFVVWGNSVIVQDTLCKKLTEYLRLIMMSMFHLVHNWERLP